MHAKQAPEIGIQQPYSEGGALTDRNTKHKRVGGWLTIT